MPFAQSTALANATLRFLTDDAFRAETRRRAYQYAKPMFWPNVGRRYLEFFTRAFATNRKAAASQHRRVTSSRTDGERETTQLVQGGY